MDTIDNRPFDIGEPDKKGKGIGRKIEKMTKNPLTYIRDLMGKAIKFNQIFQVTVILTALWFSWQNKQQAKEIEALTITNAYLLAQNRSDTRTINETPLALWKKEYFPETHTIIMQDYNDAFYEYMLKPLGMGRYDYIRHPDEDFFSKEVARVFFKEDFSVFTKYMAQPIDETGHRPIYIQEFDKHWVDLLGQTNKDGYWRWAVEVDGHYFIYGMLKRPKKGKGIKIVNIDYDFIKPEKIKIHKEKRSEA